MADSDSYICTVSHSQKMPDGSVKKFLTGATYKREEMPEDFGKHYFKPVRVKKGPDTGTPDGEGVTK